MSDATPVPVTPYNPEAPAAEPIELAPGVPTAYPDKDGADLPPEDKALEQPEQVPLPAREDDDVDFAEGVENPDKEV